MTLIRIKRFHPESDDKPGWQEFDVETRHNTTVLQALELIREQQDATLSWRSSCRMGVCGSCAMLINGQPALACNTRVHNVDEVRITLAPLANFSVIKDLVTDLAPAFEHHRRLKPYMIRDDREEIGKERRELAQTPAELLEFLQFSYCMKCCACISACPTVALSADFPGPMPLAQAQRYNADSRDDGFDERADAIEERTDLAHCHYAGECSRVCPNGVDPARAIQLMKREMVMDLLGSRRTSPATLVDAISADTSEEVDESLRPPPRTVVPDR